LPAGALAASIPFRLSELSLSAGALFCLWEKEKPVESASFKPGDWVIYRLQKTSSSPGRRAKKIMPAEHGDTYSYLVEKYWIVQEILPDAQLRLRTRRGKERVVPANDPRLRRARWWERVVYASRFRAVEQPVD
jgi:hypothetical protein